MKNKHSDPRQAVVAFLRNELERRYLYENVCRFKDLKGTDPEVVASYREFALRRLYPLGKARTDIDEAFTALRATLRSPLKAASLGAVAVIAAWNLGQRLPDVVSAGRLVVRTHATSAAVERALAKSVVEKGISWKNGLSTEDGKAVFADLPAGRCQAHTTAMVRLLETAANTETMGAGLELLQLIANAMSNKSGPWSDKDRHDMALALDTLREGMALFSKIEAKDVPRFIRGIRTVENDWEKRLRGEKGRRLSR